MTTDAEIRERLDRIETQLHALLLARAPKDWYSTADVAAALNKAEYTVREWCRHGRVRAVKKQYTRGAHPEWQISHEEFTRLRNHGLLPRPKAGVG